MIIDIDHDKVRELFFELNRSLALLEIEEDSIENKIFRRTILDKLLEDEESPIKQLAEILKVKI